MTTHPDLIKALVADRQAQLVRTAQRRPRVRVRARIRPRNPVVRHLGGLLIHLGRRLAPELRA